jgi:ribosomal protein S18 acetylase RimI-like enzyme
VTIAVRSCTPDEPGAVLASWRAAGAQPTHTDDVESITRLVTFDPDALIIADEDGDIVGSVIAAWDGWRGSIYRLTVKPTHRRAGLGLRLLGEAERRLAAKRAVRLAAIVVEDDARAVGFWRASGWEQQTRRLRFVRG